MKTIKSLMAVALIATAFCVATPQSVNAVPLDPLACVTAADEGWTNPGWNWLCAIYLSMPDDGYLHGVDPNTTRAGDQQMQMSALTDEVNELSQIIIWDFNANTTRLVYQTGA